MKKNRRKKKERWIQHYSSSQKILLVGEGDFSFSACLARAFGYAANNIVATSVHSEDTLWHKHWSCAQHLEDLEKAGCLVLHEVDAYDMNQHPTLMSMKFDIVIFNFPHAGHYHGLCEKDSGLIKKHRKLVRAFFNSSREMLTEGGEVHVTHREDYPYCEWKIVELAEKAGLILKEKVEFSKKDYPGYHNKRGGDIQCNKTFPLKCPFTFKFSLKETSVDQSSDAHASDNVGCAVAAFDELNLR